MIIGIALIAHLGFFVFFKTGYMEVFRKAPPVDEGFSGFRLIEQPPSTQPYFDDITVFTETGIQAEIADDDTAEKSFLDELGEPAMDIEPVQKGGRSGGSDGAPGPRRNFVEPKPLFMPWPKFPDGVDRKITGKVELLLFVDEKGDVMEVKISQGLGDRRLNESAIDAARKIRFIPGEIKGVPTSMWTRLTIGFQPG